MPAPKRSNVPDWACWRALSDSDREREYSPSSCVGGDYRPFIEAYRKSSLRARDDTARQGGRWQTVRYGPGAAQYIELCLPSRRASPRPGLLVFIHGGYWQELSAGDSLFAATDCLRHGLAFAAVNYTLAPAARVEDIAAECRQAIDVLSAEAPALGVDPHRIVVAGSSAGAHLSALSALSAPSASSVLSVLRSEDLPARVPHRTSLRAVVLLSGVYDLEPLIGTSINAALRLDVSSARRLSPRLADLSGFPQTIIAWGANETTEFKRQSRDFAALLGRAGIACDAFEVEGRNHFDIVFDLLAEETPLGCQTLAAVQCTKAESNFSENWPDS